MRAWPVALWFVIGCADALDIERVPDPKDPIDPTQVCVGENGAEGVGLFSLCVDITSTDWPGAATIDTDVEGAEGGCTLFVPQTGGPEACVVVARDIQIASPLTAIGSRPLVLLATRDLIVSSTASVASLPGVAGAGANTTVTCASTIDGLDSVGTSGQAGNGGAGGSFQRLGGRGGVGAGSSMTTRPIAEPEPGLVRGGCAGGAGGNVQSTGPTGGVRGSGGGAIYLVAAGSIRVDATINASGRHGARGKAAIGPGGASGGGGGGSGGLIGLDAPTIMLSASTILVANGGGGGSGGSSTLIGMDGRSANPMSPYPFLALGGVAPSGGGNGGEGDNATRAAGADGGFFSAGGGGGGGGGGGAGYIKIFTTQLEDLGAVCSPACQ